MSEVRLKSKDVEIADVGAFEIFSNVTAGYNQVLSSYDCCYFPDFLISILESTCIILFFLIFKRVITLNVTTLANLYSSTLLLSTLIILVSFVELRSKNIKALQNEPGFVAPKWSTFLFGFIGALGSLLCKLYLIRRASVILQEVVVSALSLSDLVFNMKNEVIDLTILPPHYALEVALLTASFVFDLLSILIKNNGETLLGDYAAYLSIVDSAGVFIYVMACRVSHAKNDVFYLKSLIVYLPHIYLVLALCRVFLICQPGGENPADREFSNRPLLRQFSHMLIFLMSIVCMALRNSYPEPVFMTICFTAVFERALFFCLHVDLINAIQSMHEAIMRKRKLSVIDYFKFDH